MKPSVTCLLLVLLSATPAVAQELTTGTIAGKVTPLRSMVRVTGLPFPVCM